MSVDNMNDDQKGITSFFEEGTVNVDNGFTPSIPDNSQFYCDAMNDGNINMVLNNVKPELIVLLGFSDYGKSTFVGSLYHYLLKTGSIDGYELYDSDTFSGFERRFYLRNIKNAITPYNINSMTQAAGLAAIEDEEYTQKNINIIRHVRDNTKNRLREMGFEVLDSSTNFLFARHEAISGEKIFEALKRCRIMVRHFNNPQEISDFNRITIGTAEQMQVTLEVLQRIVKK